MTPDTGDQLAVPSPKLLYRVPEAAEVLGLGVATVWRLVNRGTLPSVKVGGVRRIPATQLQEWIARQTDEQMEERFGVRRVPAERVAAS